MTIHMLESPDRLRIFDHVYKTDAFINGVIRNIYAEMTVHAFFLRYPMIK